MNKYFNLKQKFKEKKKEVNFRRRGSGGVGRLAVSHYDQRLVHFAAIKLERMNSTRHQHVHTHFYSKVRRRLGRGKDSFSVPIASTNPKTRERI